MASFIGPLRRALTILRTAGPVPLVSRLFRFTYRGLERRFGSSNRSPAQATLIFSGDQPAPLTLLAMAERPRVSVAVLCDGDVSAARRCVAALARDWDGVASELILVAPDGDGAYVSLSDACGARLSRYPRDADASSRTSMISVATAAARAPLVAFLDEALQVQPGWLRLLADTLEGGLPNGQLVGLVAGLAVRADGRLPGSSLAETQALAFRQSVRACPLGACVVRCDLADPLFFQPTAVGDPPALALADAVRRAGQAVLCQPVARVVVPDEPQWQLAAYREPWAESECRRVLILDFQLPRPDRDSGSLRMVHLIRLLQEAGLTVTFASMGLDATEPYLSRLQAEGVECLYAPQVRSVENHLREQGARYDWVFLSRAETAASLLEPARSHCPRARLVFDTVDLHFLRMEREADLKHDRRAKDRAAAMRRIELELIRAADTTLVVSAAELDLLRPLVPHADVRLLSNIHDIPGSTTPFQDRRDILFVGGFAHPPNTDAVTWFVTQVLPLIHQELPELRLAVVGAEPPRSIMDLAGPQVEVLGYVPDLHPLLASCRLSVAPLRFGAGVKGKVNQSLAHGLPVVATSLAVEGMYLVDGESVLIADESETFARAVARLYRDQALWERLSRGGLAVMDTHFSVAAARRALGKLLASPSATHPVSGNERVP